MKPTRPLQIATDAANKADDADETIAPNESIEADVTNEFVASDVAIEANAVNEANVAVDEDNGLFDNQLAELEKLDEADQVV